MSYAVYTTRGRASRQGIGARFGNRGRVSVKFKPSGRMKRERPPKRCKGKPRITRFGIFVGTIRFAGEGRYTEVDAGRARGSTGTSPRWKCKPPRGGGRSSATSDDSGVDLSFLFASTPRGSRAVGALSLDIPAEPRTIIILAGLTERQGSIRVDRLAIRATRPRTFTFDEALISATLSPPKPFSGTATFRRNPDRSTSWTGSLSVSLPGAEKNVRLAGPRFKARLYRP